MNRLASKWSGLTATQQMMYFAGFGLLGIAIVALIITALVRNSNFVKGNLTPPATLTSQSSAGNDDGTKATVASQTNAPVATDTETNTPTPTSTPTFTATPSATFTPTATMIPNTSTATAAAPTNTPAPTAAATTQVVATTEEPVDWANSCWPEDPATFQTNLMPKGYKAFFDSVAVKENGHFAIPYETLKKITDTESAKIFFEGNIPPFQGTDRTDVFKIDVKQSGKFEYNMGTFWLVLDKSCSDYMGDLVELNRLMWQKWTGREKGNETANLEGFTLCGHNPTNYEETFCFDTTKPFTKIINVDPTTGLNTCDDLDAPRRSEFYGEQNGDYQNFSFGAINCRSIAIGTFKGEGYVAHLYQDVRDNQNVQMDGKLEHYLFPTVWTKEQISNWITSYLNGVTVIDDEGVLK